MRVSDLRSQRSEGRVFKIFKRREYQQAVLKRLAELRCFILLWRRQGGKSTTLAEAALMEMMRFAGRLVTYASASLLLGREIVLKEAMVLSKALEQMQMMASNMKMELQTADAKTHEVVNDLGIDDFADLFEAQRLEFRLYHSRTVFSRTQVIAPNPATARGWTGTVMLDEFGFIREFRELWGAVEPIISTDPDFHLLMATTPPADDGHYSYELTAPPVGTRWEVNPAGNWYVSDAGQTVHRVDVHDAAAAGVKLYDLQTKQELTPAKHFARALDKDAWRRNYGIEHVVGGTAACGLLQLETAMRRGLGPDGRPLNKCVVVDSEKDFLEGLDFLIEHLGKGPVGCGWDLATTEHETSNPNGFAVVEQDGINYLVRMIFVWKTSDPQLARERAEIICRGIEGRPGGGRARRLCIDATNERYFATDLRRELGRLVPVELVIGSETKDVPGEGPMSMKKYLGSRLVAALDANRLTLPPDRYVKEDFRLVKKERGEFVCVPTADGRHGDTFDGVKLGMHALESTAGAILSMEGIKVGGQGRRTWRPRTLLARR